jgi:hypothetical protein
MKYLRRPILMKFCCEKLNLVGESRKCRRAGYGAVQHHILHLLFTHHVLRHHQSILLLSPVVCSYFLSLLRITAFSLDVGSAQPLGRELCSHLLPFNTRCPLSNPRVTFLWSHTSQSCTPPISTHTHQPTVSLCPPSSHTFSPARRARAHD